MTTYQSVNRVNVVMYNLLTFLSARKRDGKGWSKPSVKSQRKDHVTLMQEAITRSLRMGLTETSGGFLRITVAGVHYATRGFRG